MAIPRPYFFNLTDASDADWIATLKRWLGWVQEEVATGKVNIGWSAGDTSATKQVDMSLPASKRRAMILNDLCYYDPDNWDAREFIDIKRTVPRYDC